MIRTTMSKTLLKKEIMIRDIAEKRSLIKKADDAKLNMTSPEATVIMEIGVKLTARQRKITRRTK